MVQIKKYYMILIVLSIPVTFIWGWVLGVNDGVNTGYNVAYQEMNNLLKQGVEGGLNFTINGVNARFVPRQDKSIAYKVSADVGGKKSRNHRM
ncbi:MAG: hypothetical protein AB1553_15445 [Nitrospirota bacterium]